MLCYVVLLLSYLIFIFSNVFTLTCRIVNRFAGDLLSRTRFICYTTAINGDIKCFKLHRYHVIAHMGYALAQLMKLSMIRVYWTLLEIYTFSMKDIRPQLPKVFTPRRLYDLDAIMQGKYCTMVQSIYLNGIKKHEGIYRYHNYAK